MPPPAAAPSAAVPAQASTTTDTSPARDDEVKALREEIRALRDEVHATATDKTPDRSGASSKEPLLPVPLSPNPHPVGHEAFWPWVTPSEGVSGFAYAQTQYVWNESSQDQLTQSGTPYNQDRFVIRRARAAVTGEWQYAALFLELDANTNNGPQVDLRKAEASLQYRPDRTRPPMVMATMGMFDVPFGYELVESPRTRWFMERSTGSQALFPSEPDLGLRVSGALDWFRWTIAGVNGNPMGETPNYALQDPLAAKDVVFRFGVDTTPLRDLNIAGDISALRGKGFHPGTSATKSSLQWTDVNESGVVQPFDTIGVPGEAATPSKSFDRWAVGADLRVHYRWWLGDLKVYGEIVLASNLDRSLYVADPILSTLEQRELDWYAGATQEVTRYGLIGLRYDLYDPNSNAFDKRAGQLIPYSEAIKTISPLVGLTLPERARLVFQYDFNTNAFGRSSVGALVASACDDGVPANSGVGEPIVINGAQFISGSLPGSAPDESTTPTGDDGGSEGGASKVPPLSVTSVGFLNALVLPGFAGKSFNGRVTSDSAAIGIALQGLGTGYWVVPIQATDPDYPGQSDFSFSANFSADDPPGRRQLLTVAIDGNGNAGQQVGTYMCFQSRIPDNLHACNPKAKVPQAVFTLMWDANFDLDLHVIFPDGRDVNPKNPVQIVPDSGAPPRSDPSIDRDSLRACVPDGLRQEDLVFQNAPPKGTYLLYADPFDSCGQESVRFNMIISEPASDGSLKTTYTRSGELLQNDVTGGASTGLFVAQKTFE